MRIDGLVPGQNINLSNISDILGKLNVGEVIRAQILEITSNELLLKLFDGTTFTAASAVQIDAKRGDFVNLSVKNKTDSQIFLETVKTNSDIKPESPDVDLKTQLLELNIKPDIKSMDIAKEMQANNIPLNKENLGKIADLVTKFKGLSPAGAAFLSSNNISVEEKNISTLNQLVNGKMQLGKDLEELSSLLDALETDRSSNSWNSADTSQNKTGSANQIKNVNTPVVTMEESLPEVKSIMKTVNDELTAVNNNKIIDSNVKSAIMDLKLPERLLTAFSSSDLPAQDIIRKAEGVITNNLKNIETLQPDIKKAVADILESIILKFKNRSELSIQDTSNSTQTEGAKFVNRLNISLHKELKDIFVKINSENLKDDLNVKNIYRNTLNRLELLKENLESVTSPVKSQVIAKIDNIESNMRFIGELNNYNTYIQIPLNTWNKNTTGELYILKNSLKKKKIDPENVTLLISLDTGNLGRVDSLISVNKRNISVNMRVEDKNVINAVKEHYKDLYNALKLKGYKLVDLKCRPLEDDINILNVKENIKKMAEDSKKAFDYRI